MSNCALHWHLQPPMIVSNKKVFCYNCASFHYPQWSVADVNYCFVICQVYMITYVFNYKCHTGRCIAILKQTQLSSEFGGRTWSMNYIEGKCARNHPLQRFHSFSAMSHEYQDRSQKKNYSPILGFMVCIFFRKYNRSVYVMCKLPSI